MVFATVRSLGSFFATFSYSVMAFCSLPCWTNFSAALRTFCLLKPNPNAIEVRTPAPFSSWSENPSGAGEFAGGSTPPRHLPTLREMVLRTRVIVRLGSQNRMVTKGYRKGVYDRVTMGTMAKLREQKGWENTCHPK